jgi:hypothetical protein
VAVRSTEHVSVRVRDKVVRDQAAFDRLSQ